MDHNRMNRGCGCQNTRPAMRQDNRNMSKSREGIRTLPVDTMVHAMAYVPMQRFEQIYDLSLGLQLGTIFPELCKPFCGKGGAGCR